MSKSAKAKEKDKVNGVALGLQAPVRQDPVKITTSRTNS